MSNKPLKISESDPDIITEVFDLDIPIFKYISLNQLLTKIT